MTEHAIALTDVSRTYRGGAGVQQVDLSVRRGEIHALVGLNGAGKSTLMKLMVGMLRPTSGRIEVLGRSATEAEPASTPVPPRADPPLRPGKKLVGAEAPKRDQIAA